MQKLVLIILASAVLFVPVGNGSAQIFNPRSGNGDQIEPRYVDRYEDRYERRRNQNRDLRDGDRGDYRRSGNGCRPNYIVQDGVCTRSPIGR